MDNDDLSSSRVFVLDNCNSNKNCIDFALMIISNWKFDWKVHKILERNVV
jgi:hypothetical protein